jgi:hypothetical protein
LDLRTVLASGFANQASRAGAVNKEKENFMKRLPSLKGGLRGHAHYFRRITMEILRKLLVTAIFSMAALGCAAQESFESYPAGTRLTTQISGAQFLSYAEVFTPARVRTSGRQAVRGCAGCTEIQIGFSPNVAVVSLDVGMDAQACNNDQCFDTAVRLQAVDAAGNLIMSSAPVSLDGYPDINHRLQVSDAAARIASVRIRYTNLGMTGLGRVSFDNLFFSTSGGSTPHLDAPRITFTAPAEGALLPRSPWIRGHIDAPAGVLAMCVAANTVLTPACGGERQSWVRPGTLASDFSIAPLALHPGLNTVYVLVRDNLNQTSPPASLHVQLFSAATGIDFAAKNLLITQGIQMTPLDGSGDFALSDGGGGGLHARYNGVRLARDAKTVVRFFADVASSGDASGIPLRPSARLFGFIDRGSAGGAPFGPDRGEILGASLPGSPLSPDAMPFALSAPVSLSANVSNATAGYQFTLPASWTETGAIILQAEVNPQSLPDAIPEANRGNNGFQLEQVQFASPHDAIRIYGVALTYTGAPGGFGEFDTVPDPWFAYDHVRRLVPMRIDVPGYRTILDISSIMNSGSNFNTQSGQVLSLLGHYNDEGLSNQYVVGFTESNRQSSLPIQGLGQGFFWGHGVAYVAPSRPLTSVGHETFHLLGFNHAGGSCPGVAGSGGIDTWPAGDMGNILGTGLDVNNVFGPSRGYYQLVADDPSTTWFDFMSYCADPDEHDSWISTRNWNRFLGGPDITSALLEGIPFPTNWSLREELAQGGASNLAAPVALLISPDEVTGTGPNAMEQADLSSSAQSVEAPALKPIPSKDPTLRVFAWVTDKEAMIWRVTGGKKLLTPADPQSPYRFVVRGASGEVVSDTPVAAASVHLHHDHSQKFFADEIAAPGAEWVQLVYRGAPCPAARVESGGPDCVLAERRRNPHPPTVTISEPQADSILAEGKAVRVSWTASGLDGNAQSFVDLEYSTDDGTTWRPIAGNLSGNSALLPAHLFSTSKAARLRLTLNDGFNETVAVSERFSSPGMPPSVHIVNPVNQFNAPFGTAVYFSGEGYDDAGNRLSPKQLEWFDDKAFLGTGEVFSSSKLAPGVHTIQLVAHDSDGRTAAATETIEIILVSSGGDKPQETANQPRPDQQTPVNAPAGSTILVPEQAFAGGVLTGVVLGPDDQPVANTPVQIAGGGVPGDLSGEVLGDEPSQPPSDDKPKTTVAEKQPGGENGGATPANKQPGVLAACAEKLKAIAAGKGNNPAETIGAAQPTIGAPQLKNAVSSDAPATDKNSLAAQAASMVRTDAQGRFALCVLPDVPKVAVSLPAASDKDGKQPAAQGEAKVAQAAAAEPVPQPPFPHTRPPDFVQPGEKFTLPGNFPKGDYEQSGQKGNLPVAIATSPDGAKSISTFKAPQGLKPGVITFHLTDPKGKQTSYTGGVFKILRASLDRAQLRSDQGADFSYEVLATPETVPDGLCVDVKLVGPVVMVQPPPPQVPLDSSGYGKFGGKIRAVQVAPGSAVPFDIRTNFHGCKTASQ